MLAQDAISVGGGTTANMLAIWRVHGFDRILREAWESGVVLFGASAGMICWFEAGVTDSFGPGLDGMRDGLGLLAGSACPHYDGEALRRPRYRELVDGGFPEGIAADDGVGLHYVGTELREVVTCRPGATAYRVTRDGEERLAARDSARPLIARGARSTTYPFCDGEREPRSTKSSSSRKKSSGTTTTRTTATAGGASARIRFRARRRGAPTSRTT